MNRKRVVILGATGSIGESALKVARDIPERMDIVGLAAKSNAQKLAAAANEVRPESVCLVNETQIDVLRDAADDIRLKQFNLFRQLPDQVTYLSDHVDVNPIGQQVDPTVESGVGDACVLELERAVFDSDGAG